MSNIGEKDFYNLTVSISKALNGLEAPLKTKHARSVIILIHKAKEAKSFWMVISRQPLMESRFTAWKFCHLLHKVLREAHESVLKDSQSHRKMILEMGKLWGHLQDDIGFCIKAYSQLLVTKLNFHDKNRVFPGSLLITMNEIAKFADKDLNVYFQLCVEIYDYLDDIIALQLSIFSSFNTYRMSSMTKQGQCRLAPVICLIQDSNALYDITVRLMFKLHKELPSDVLSGHRTRFEDIFIKLKRFYEGIRPLQYFSDLIQVPQLPESSPNFRSQVDFGSYIPPVVLVQPEPESVVEDLVNTNFDENRIGLDVASQRIDTLETIISDKDITIEQLKGQMDECKMKYDDLEANYKRDVLELQGRNNALCTELASSQEICTNMRLEKEELELQITNNPNLIQKVMEEEEKLKLSAEKFTKLKTMYTQIRDEHINLLRQQNEISKALSKEKQQNSEMNLEIESLNRDISEFKSKTEALTSNNAKLSKQLDDQNDQYMQFQDDWKKNLNEIVEEKKCENLELVSTIEALKDNLTEFENYKLKLQQTEEKLSMAENNLKMKEENLLTQAKNHENESRKLATNMEETKEVLGKECEDLRVELTKVQTSMQVCEIVKEELHQTNITLQREIDQLHKKNLDLGQKAEELESRLTIAVQETAALTVDVNKATTNLNEMIKLIIDTVQKNCGSKTQHPTQLPLEAIPKITSEMKTLLSNLDYGSDAAKNLCIAKIREIICLGYEFINLYDQCDLIYNSTTEIEKGQDILSKSHTICKRLQTLLEICQNEATSQQITTVVSDLKMQLSELNQLVQELLDTSKNTVDLDKIVEMELKEMDLAIEEAAQKICDLLSSARKKDNGLKLEVNEKILDSCTSLMECIKNLIIKSRLLQQEIVSTRKGNASVNEFYKRNSQWSEGLISASKSVAKAANYLVEAANNSVVNESGKNFEIIVAAQEIAACTAQLVIASKVKANRESKNLAELTSASRNVTKATGNVVATVKDCNHQMEQSIDIDFRKLTPSQFKTMEMEIQVKVLELEQALQTQRMKLSAFRRDHYQNTE